MTNPPIPDLLGPLAAIYADPDVVEILVDNAATVYVERQGQLEDVPTPFAGADELAAFVTQLTARLGRQVGPDDPVVDLRLADGTRINVVVPPVALTGPSLVIRKLPARLLTVDDLLRYGSWSESIMAFLRACVQARLNVLIAGGTGSGKTTVLNLVAGMIPLDERLVVVENNTELRLPHRRIVRLESRPPNPDGRGAVSVRELLATATRMRPDRIVLGEAIGDEALEMIAALNTGHDGSLFSLHATSPRDALTRLEVMIQLAGLDLPLLTIRQQIASALHVIAYQERLADGRRKIMRVAEVVGLDGHTITLRDLFAFRQTGLEGGRIQGVFEATGQPPYWLDRFIAAGVKLPPEMFPAD